MFLAIDESIKYPKKLLGGVLLPTDRLSDFEKAFVELRLKHKLFGEVKWSSIDQYYKRYVDFVDLFFDDKMITFHSTCFRREKYKSAYVFIRGITWKLQNAGIKEPLIVLFDNDGAFGNKETREISKIAKTDAGFKQNLDFCNQGASHVLGVLQLTDLLTGTVSSAINNLRLSQEKSFIYNHIFKRNNNLPLNLASETFPKLYDYKIHYFDPDDVPVIKTK